MSQRMAEKVVTMRCEAHDALTPDSQLNASHANGFTPW